MSQPRALILGDSTAGGGLVEHRVSKLADRGLVHGRWLDCGCADGYYAAALREHGAHEVVGTDIAPDRIAAARTHWGAVAGLAFAVAAAERMPFDDESFDGALMNEVLEHVRDEARALAEIRRLLRAGGHLAVFSPNRWFPFEGHGAVVGRMELAFPVPLLPWLPKRFAARFMNARNYWPGELASLVANAGFTVTEVAFAFPLFTRYRWLPDVAIKHYSRAVERLEGAPFVRRFGVSTLVIAQKEAP
jgi:SAM-dependent methyltransferase